MGNGIFKYVKYLMQCILDIIFFVDLKCPICDNNIESFGLCKVCEGKIIFISDSFYIENNGIRFEGRSYAYYSDVIAKLIMNLKYKADFYSGEIIAKYMINIAKDIISCFDLICFVPCDKRTLKSRGFNQAEYLAEYLGKEFDLKVISCIKKVKGTKDQIGLSYNDRWDNIKDCYKIYNEGKIKNKNIILIDDVITTGATVYFCSKCLIDNGAGKVFILTAARSRL